MSDWRRLDPIFQTADMMEMRMGFFSGLTANGILGTVARGDRDGSFLPPFAGPAAAPAAERPARGAGLLHQLGGALDPQRLAMIQATLAGDYEAVARMTEPMRRQRLARLGGVASMADHGASIHLDGPSLGGEGADPWAPHTEAPSPWHEPAHGTGTSLSDAGPAFQPTRAAAGMDEGGERFVANQGPGSLRARPVVFQEQFERQSDRHRAERIARETGRDAEEVYGEMRGLGRADRRPEQRRRDPARGRAVAGAGISKPEERGKPDPQAGWEAYVGKLRRGGGLNGYGYIPTAEEVNLLTRAAYSEFGEMASWPDLHAGVWAILNRVRPSGGYGPHRAELGPNVPEVLNRRNPRGQREYSFVPPGGIDAPGGSAAWRRSANPETMVPLERKAWDLTLQAVKDVLGGQVPDPTAGATIFHSRRHALPENAGSWWRSLRRSPYQSPNNQNFFYQAPEEPERPFFDKPSPYWPDRSPSG